MKWKGDPEPSRLLNPLPGTPVPRRILTSIDCDSKPLNGPRQSENVRRLPCNCSSGPYLVPSPGMECQHG